MWIKSNKKVLLGGSFDPITIAHVEMIKYLSDRYGEVIILPNGDDYSFHGKKLTPYNLRVDMINLAIKGLSNVTVSDYYKNNKFVGVYKTLEDLNHPVYACGEDCLDTINEWVNVDTLVKDNKFLVFKRGCKSDCISTLFKNKLTRKYLHNFKIASLKTSNVSSSKFRDNLSKNIVTNEVYDYVMSNKLYK